jgi:type IV pilus assembly protein PilF
MTVCNYQDKNQYSLWLLVPVVFLVLASCTNTPWHAQQAEVFLNKGISYIEIGRYNNAIKELMEAEKYSPQNPKIHYYLGMSYHYKDMKDMAMEELKKAIALDANYSEAHNYLGTLYLDSGHWDQAIEEFQLALRNYLYDTPAIALYNMGWAYYSKADYNAALARYEEALRKDPMTNLRPKIEKNIGLVYIKQAKRAQAKMHLEKAISLDPSLLDAYFFLAETCLEIRDTANAKKYFRQVVSLAPQSPFGQKSLEYLHSLE